MKVENNIKLNNKLSEKCFKMIVLHLNKNILNKKMVNIINRILELVINLIFQIYFTMFSFKFF